MSEPLEACRASFESPDRRHLRVMETAEALCGAKAPYGAGGGTHESLLRWPTCSKCHSLASARTPAESQSEAPSFPQGVLL